MERSAPAADLDVLMDRRRGCIPIAEQQLGRPGWVKGGRSPLRSNAVGALDAFWTARLMDRSGASPQVSRRETQPRV